MCLPGGAPLPGNPCGGAPGKPPGAPGNPPKPPGPGPPTPAAGPVRPVGRPLPAGLLIPGPTDMAAGGPPGPGASFPSRAAGSAGGGPSTVDETTWAPRTIVKPNVRFSSVSTNAGSAEPGAADFVGRRLTLRNSSVSAMTRFMCCRVISLDQAHSECVEWAHTLSNASIWPAI